MKKNIFNKYLLLTLTVLFSLNIFTVLAAGIATPECGEGTSLKAGICVPNAEGDGILGSGNAIELAKNVFNIMLYLAGVIAVLYVIIGGYQYLTSGGNDEQAEKGKNTVTNALIGLIIIVLAFTIVNVLTGTIGGTTGG